MQVLDNYYLIGVNIHKNTETMHDLKANFDKILPIVKETLCEQLNAADNLQRYPHQPAWPDSYIITFALLQEALAIDSERWLWSKLKVDYAGDFPNLPHRTRYNRRRNRLAGWIEKLARMWSQHICPAEDIFLVDYLPVPVAHVAREHSTRVCREHYHSAPDKGYNATFGQYYIGYKLHMVVSLRGSTKAWI